jgi:molybdopterin-synthase adenylyltransferase
MSLSEEQIARFARQILVKPIGGRGQQALCSATARVSGSQLARTYLEAGGTLEGDGGWLAVGSGRFEYAIGCSQCTPPALTPTEDVELAATAALAYQRAVLGLAPRCSRHA